MNGGDGALPVPLGVAAQQGRCNREPTAMALGRDACFRHCLVLLSHFSAGTYRAHHLIACFDGMPPAKIMTLP